MVIAGGADAGLTATMFAGLAKMGPAVGAQRGARAGQPAVRRRPRRFVFGEGAVVMVVESAEHAAARGARGLRHGRRRRSDQRRVSHQRPRAVRGPRRPGHRLALERAGVEPERARLHLRARHRHPGQRRRRDARRSSSRSAPTPTRVPASSPKSMVGHLIGAAGALSVMACLLAMRDGVLPPTTNLHTPDPECDLDYVPAHGPRRPTVRTAAANAFGFGGQNCVVVLARARAALAARAGPRAGEGHRRADPLVGRRVRGQSAADPARRVEVGHVLQRDRPLEGDERLGRAASSSEYWSARRSSARDRRLPTTPSGALTSAGGQGQRRQRGRGRRARARAPSSAAGRRARRRARSAPRRRRCGARRGGGRGRARGRPPSGSRRGCSGPAACRTAPPAWSARARSRRRWRRSSGGWRRPSRPPPP